MKRKIYVASSWRNEYYPDVVVKLREAGHDVYDFRNPPSGDPGFKWSSVSEDYMEWTPQQYRAIGTGDLRWLKAEGNNHPIEKGVPADSFSLFNVSLLFTGNRECIEVRALTCGTECIERSLTANTIISLYSIFRSICPCL